MPLPTPSPAPSRSPRPGGSPPNPMRSSRMWIWLALLLGLNFLIADVLLAPSQTKRVTISYSAFLQQVESDNVTAVTSTSDTIEGHVKKAVKSTDGKDQANDFTTQRPSFADDNLVGLLQQHRVDVAANPPDEGRSLWANLLLGFGPTILLVLAFVWFYRRMAGAAGGAGGGGVFGMGRSQARLYDAEHPTSTFADVAGIDEAKEELMEIVDFLRDPSKYQRLGGAMPKGVLLVGPPGGGKTLLARAVAGEAKVPFFSVSASEFVEMIVGVGAARVRDLFNRARQAAPAIIFIDELDAIGRSRGGTFRMGGHDEQEQTLNQILTEMDGFDPREGVVVLSATNRPDVLDSALLRAGRFDRRVTVQPPDRPGRVAILRIHTRTVPLAPDVDLERLGAMTPGLVGADLRNLVNEAALLAARRNRDAVAMEDFGDAFEKVLLGAERHIALSPRDRQRTAYHESGHALVALLTPGSDPVRKISIVPRGRALGVTVQSPVDDRQDYQEDYLRGRIASTLGGRAAEMVVFGVASTGAENDLKQATMLAREMVTRWGMSERIGPVSLPDEGDGGSPFARPMSEATARLVDDEVRGIVTAGLEAAMAVLRRHRPTLDALATALLEEESLDEDAILRVTGLTSQVHPVEEAARALGGSHDGGTQRGGTRAPVPPIPVDRHPAGTDPGAPPG